MSRDALTGDRRRLGQRALESLCPTPSRSCRISVITPHRRPWGRPLPCVTRTRSEVHLESIPGGFPRLRPWAGHYVEALSKLRAVRWLLGPTLLHLFFRGGPAAPHFVIAGVVGACPPSPWYVSVGRESPMRAWRCSVL